MGDKITKYYEYAAQKGGITLQMRLAMKTGVTSVAAKTVQDTPDQVMKFQSVLKELLNDPNIPRF
jgi:hypothetical protein